MGLPAPLYGREPFLSFLEGGCQEVLGGVRNSFLGLVWEPRGARNSSYWSTLGFPGIFRVSWAAWLL